MEAEQSDVLEAELISDPAIFTEQLYKAILTDPKSLLNLESTSTYF